MATTTAATVTVSYELGNTGKRRNKTFDDANAAKLFYTAKDKAGRNPKLVTKDKPRVATKAAPAGLPGVSFVITRPYVCGQVLAEYGLDVGITENMIKAVDARYGKQNPRETAFALRNAWHAARAMRDAAASK